MQRIQAELKIPSNCLLSLQFSSNYCNIFKRANPFNCASYYVFALGCKASKTTVIKILRFKIKFLTRKWFAKFQSDDICELIVTYNESGYFSLINIILQNLNYTEGRCRWILLDNRYYCVSWLDHVKLRNISKTETSPRMKMAILNNTSK